MASSPPRNIVSLRNFVSASVDSASLANDPCEGIGERTRWRLRSAPMRCPEVFIKPTPLSGVSVVEAMSKSPLSTSSRRTQADTIPSSPRRSPISAAQMMRTVRAFEKAGKLVIGLTVMTDGAFELKFGEPQSGARKGLDLVTMANENG